ncbi:MAG: hypothetical protein BroJett033_3570 [Chloroflexota bacterium]|nr:MAG: hypothetical protein BroJett033_3570 [Chloroflexota bacterium]
MIPAPTPVLGFILATLCGALFHLIVGGDARRLALFLLAAWVGFGLGHLLGVFLGIDVMAIGSLRVVTAVMGAGVALLAVYVLTAKRAVGRSRE